jgi:hypothetical protein
VLARLWGEAGDPIVSLRHLKSPAEAIGPFGVTLNFGTGAVTIYEASSLLGILAAAPNGLSAHDAAAIWLETSNVTAAKKEKARRALEKLVKDDRVTWGKGPGQNDPRIYAACTPVHRARAPIRGVHEPDGADDESPIGVGNEGCTVGVHGGCTAQEELPLPKEGGSSCTSEEASDGPSPPDNEAFEDLVAEAERKLREGAGDA